MLQKQHSILGLYEKALPTEADWSQRLALAGELGFDYVEMSIDESDARLERLAWSRQQRLALVKAISDSGVRVASLCLSAHRRFPLGSEDPAIRQRGLTIMAQAIQLAQDTGIRVIQLAGYDEYYHRSTPQTQRLFREGLQQAVVLASQAQVMLALETMDTPLMNSVSNALGYQRYLDNPWLQIYPDVGNLSAWQQDLHLQLQAGKGHIVAVHIKDTRPGEFKNVPFGEGIVDFRHCFSTLYHSGYRGPYLIEMWSGDSPQAVTHIREARRRVTEQMQLAGLPAGRTALC